MVRVASVILAMNLSPLFQQEVRVCADNPRRPPYVLSLHVTARVADSQGFDFDHDLNFAPNAMHMRRAMTVGWNANLESILSQDRGHDRYMIIQAVGFAIHNGRGFSIAVEASFDWHLQSANGTRRP